MTVIDTTIHQTMIEQIGRMTLLGASGGRKTIVDESTLRLPVGNGYSVEVVYDFGWDYYTVRRVFTRGGKRWVKGEISMVDCFQLSEAVWAASCYRNVAFGDHDPMA